MASSNRIDTTSLTSNTTTTIIIGSSPTQTNFWPHKTVLVNSSKMTSPIPPASPYTPEATDNALKLRGITMLDPRSKEFLDSVPKEIGFQLTATPGEITIVANELVSAAPALGPTDHHYSKVGGVLVTSRMAKRCIDIFVARHNPVSPGESEIRYFDSGVTKLKQLNERSFNGYNSFRGPYVSVNLMNEFKLPNNDGSCFSYRIKDIYSSKIGRIQDKGGFILNVWLVKSLLDRPAYTPIEYEADGLSYFLYRHILKFYGMDLKSNGDIFLTVQGHDEVITKQVPLLALPTVAEYFCCNLNMLGSRFEPKYAFDRFARSSLITQDMFCIGSTGTYIGPPEFRTQHTALDQFCGWLLTSPSARASHNFPTTFDTGKINLAFFLKRDHFTPLAEFLRDIQKDITASLSKSILRKDLGDKAVKQISASNYEKVLYRPKLAENLGVL